MKVPLCVKNDPLRAASLFAASAGVYMYLRLVGVSCGQSASTALSLAVVGVLVWAREFAVFGSEPARPKPKKDTFDWGMHYMRGFAIVCIMLLHLCGRLGHATFTRAFFHASTVYFLFISGYLCQYLALKKPVVDHDYYVKKFTNVILPYILCSFATAFLVWLGGGRIGVVQPNGLSPIGIVKMLLLGKAQNPYWYIPFVTVLFAVSPFLTRLSLSALVWCTLVAFVASLVFPSRQGSLLTFNVFDFGSKYTFFSVYYLAGILYARLKSRIDPYLQSYAVPSLVFAFVLGLNSLRPGLFPVPVLNSEVFASLQKGLLLVPVLVIANSLKHHRVVILDAFAEYSFTLFFLHYFFIQDYIRFQAHFRNNVPGWILDPVLVVLFLLQILVLAILLKKALGRWSRSFIGS